MPDTTYYIVAEGTTGQVRAALSDDEDTDDTADGWSVADDGYTRTASSTGAWTSNTQSLMLRVNGFERAASAPGKPAPPTGAATSPVSVRVSWAPPPVAGRTGTVTDYDLRWFQGTADPATEADWTEEGEPGAWPNPRSSTSVDVTGLTPNTAYRVQVRAQDGGEGPWSDSVTVTTQMALANPVSLLSNIAESDHATARADLADHDWGQDLWTGDNDLGYALGTVDIDFATKPSDDLVVVVRLRTDTGLGDHPIVATLVNPAALAAGNLAFTAPAGTRLAPNSRYFVNVRATSGQLAIKDRAGGFPNCNPTTAPCIGPLRYHFADGRTDGDLINPQISPPRPLGIQINGVEFSVPVTTMASNIGQNTDHQFSLNGTDHAGAFTTGTNVGGYRLSDIEISFGDGSLAGLEVKLATGLPAATTEVATLNNPASFPPGTGEDRVFRFTAPANTTLMPNTTYFVWVHSSFGVVNITESSDQDAGSTEFTIGDTGYTRSSSSTGVWGTSMAPRLRLMKFRVNGRRPAAHRAGEAGCADGDGDVADQCERVVGRAEPLRVCWAGSTTTTCAGSRAPPTRPETPTGRMLIGLTPISPGARRPSRAPRPPRRSPG